MAAAQDSHLRVKTFGILCGLTDTHHWTERSVCFIFNFFEELKREMSPSTESKVRLTALHLPITDMRNVGFLSFSVRIYLSTPPSLLQMRPSCCRVARGSPPSALRLTHAPPQNPAELGRDWDIFRWERPWRSLTLSVC